MGNCSMRSADSGVITPSMCTFDESEVAILKKSWAILSVKVSEMT